MAARTEWLPQVAPEPPVDRRASARAELQLRGIDVTEKGGRLIQPRGVDDPYLRKFTGLAFLAPDIQQAILEGQQPAGLTLSTLPVRSPPARLAGAAAAARLRQLSRA